MKPIKTLKLSLESLRDLTTRNLDDRALAQAAGGSLVPITKYISRNFDCRRY